MRRTDAGTRGRRLAAALLAAGAVVGLVATPAAAVDSIRDQQWHLDAMKASEIWQTSKGAGVTVAVIDSGFKLDHPDLVGQLLPGKDFSGLPGGVGDDKSGHGTGIAGIIAGTGKGLGGKGAYGLAPEAKILPLKTHSDSNSDSAAGVSGPEFLKQIDQAIIYAADQGAKVINISQAGPASSFSASDINDLKAAVAHASSKGSLVIAGAGNSAKEGNPVMYPAALPTIVAAAATDRSGVVTDESERGSQIDLAAPGMDIYRPCTGPSGYCKSHGTSDATAIVSASAALLWSVHPDWSANQILRVLINTAGKPQDGSARTDLIGYGTVRPRIALTTPGDPGPANVSPLIGQMEGEVTPAPSATATAPGQATAAPGSPAASAPGEGSEPVDLPVTGQASDGGSGNLPLVIGGSAAALAVVAVVVVLLMRRRRAASAAVPTPPPAPVGIPYGQQLPPQGGPGSPAAAPYGQTAPPQYSPPAGPPQYGTPPQYGPPADPPVNNPYAQ